MGYNIEAFSLYWYITQPIDLRREGFKLFHLASFFKQIQTRFSSTVAECNNFITISHHTKTQLMKFLFALLITFNAGTLFAQKDSAVTLKLVLLEQLKTTHNAKDWFVPVNTAVAGLTAEQANWKDSTGNHSIAQLTTHLIFWNKQVLDKFKNMKPDAFSGNNKETFSKVDDKTWNNIVIQLDGILTEWEQQVQAADEKKLQAWYSTIAHIGTHNAYHTGQILYIRKMKGWWQDENGVK
jgi:DinB superfamily